MFRLFALALELPEDYFDDKVSFLLVFLGQHIDKIMIYYLDERNRSYNTSVALSAANRSGGFSGVGYRSSFRVSSLVVIINS